jgi:hypothetical protein
MSTAVVERLQPETAIVPLTPMDMLNRAVTSGADIEVLEKLLVLQERWEKSQARKAFDEAISLAKADIKPVVKNRTGHNNKRYADFSAIAAAVDPVIAKHGLSYRFRSTQDERIHVTCVLSHKDGHYEETTLAGPADASGSKNAIQAIGSTLTYLQRYSLIQALGLAASEDDDGRTGASAAPLTNEQIDRLTKLISETKSDVGRFLNWAGAESVSDITQGRFAECLTMLEAKKNGGKS